MKLKKIIAGLLVAAMTITVVPVHNNGNNVVLAAQSIGSVEKYNEEQEFTDYTTLQNNADTNSDKAGSANWGDAGVEAVFDADDSSFWHSDRFVSSEQPIYIQTGFGEKVTVSKLVYASRPNLASNIMGDYEIEVIVTEDGDDEDTLPDKPTDDAVWTQVATGTFAANANEQQVAFEPTQATFIRITTTSKVGGGDDHLASRSIKLYTVTQKETYLVDLINKAQIEVNAIKTAGQESLYDVTRAEAIIAQAEEATTEDEKAAVVKLFEETKLNEAVPFEDEKGRGLYLSDLEWTSSATGYGTAGVVRDGAHKDSAENTTNALELRNEDGGNTFTTFVKGIGGHADGHVQLDVSDYKKFTAYYGTSGNKTNYGDIEFKIFLDGTEATQYSGASSWNTGMDYWDVDLENADVLKIAFEAGNNNWNDHAGLGDAKLYTHLVAVPEIVVEPLEGNELPVLADTVGYSVETQWAAEGGEEVPTHFVAGMTYTLTATYTANERYYFTEDSLTDWTMTLTENGVTTDNIEPLSKTVAEDQSTLTATWTFTASEVHKEALPKPNLSIAEPVVGGTLGKVEYADYTEKGIEDIADSPATLTTEGLTIENVDGYQAFNGKITAVDTETNNGKFDVYGNTPLLIRFKVYVPSGITDSQTLIGKTDNQYGIQVAGTEEGTELKLYANHNDTVWSETNLIIRTDAWHDVIATYTYDTGLNLFVDGDEGAQRDQPTVPTDISGYELQQNRSNNFAIGYNNSDSNSNSNIDSRKFEGKLADVVMYTGDQVPTITSETTADDIKAALATKTPMFELDVTAESGTKPNYTITNTVWTNAAGEEVESLNTAGMNTVTATLTPNEGYAFTDENTPTTMALAGTENTVAVSSATINDDGTMTVSCQFDGILILQKDNLEAAIVAAEKVLALNPSDETAKESLRTAIASAKNELVSGNATTGSLNEVTNSLTRSVNAVVAVKGNTGTGYTVTVFGGGTLKHAGDNELTAGTTEQDGLNYNDKVIVSAPTESEKGEFVGWEVLGDIVGKGTLDRETKTYQYTFYVPNNVTITAVYGTADEEPTATMTNVVVTANGDNADKVDMKFVGQLTVPDGYKLKNAGLVYMVNNKSDAPTVTADGINEAEGWTYKQVEKVNASYQYSVTFKGATPAQENGTPNYLYAAVYAQFVKLDENGNETEEFTWVSSKPVQVNAKVTE